MKLSMFVVACAMVAALLLPGGQGAASAAPKPQVVTVAMYEFGFKMSTKTVRVGTVVFVVSNKGKVPHDFEILGTKKKTPVFVGTRVVRLTVTFKKAGKFRIQCTVPGHIDAGMWGYLTVKRA